MTKRIEGEPTPLEGLAEERITRARAMKLFGAMMGTGAFALFLPDEADAANKRRRRRRRRRRERRRRQNNVTSDQSTIDFGDVTVGVPTDPQFVEIQNNGSTPVTIDPTVVGEGFTLGDLSGLDLRLAEGETVRIPVIADVDAGGVSTGALQIRDAADGLLLETVNLEANGLL